MMMEPDNYLEIDSEALRHNARTVIEYVDRSVIAVLKCNGYGATIPVAARVWKDCGAAMFAVSAPHEALALREAGFHEDVLLLAPVVDARTLLALLDANIILPVTGTGSAKFYSDHRQGKPVRVHVAVDTGMGRFGIRWSDITTLKSVYTYDLHFEGIYSHFAASYERRYQKTKTQLSRFLTVTAALEREGLPVGLRHIANSCAALRFPDTRLDAVRIGSALVGQLCAESPVCLQRAAILKARVVDRRLLKKGDTTGYGAVCKVKQDTEAIVAAVGYDTGLGHVKTPWMLPAMDLAAYAWRMVRLYRKLPYARCEGKKIPMIGRVGGQYTLFDAKGTQIEPGGYVSIETDVLFPYRIRQIK